MAKRLDDRDTRHDRFHQKAKREGFLARAVYKLEEIDQKHDLFGGATRVLDLGCAPGSWLQYAYKRIGPSARLVGLDRELIDQAPRGARILAGDVLTIEVAELLGDLPAFDVVMSDMAPDTTGVRHVDQARSEALFERALEIATSTLAPGGNFVGKLFQGPEFKALNEAVRARFTSQRVAKPASSRQISIEQYVVGKGFRGLAALGLAPAGGADGAQPRGAQTGARGRGAQTGPAGAQTRGARPAPPARSEPDADGDDDNEETP